MSAPWWEAELEVPLAWADDASAWLVAEGASGVEVISAHTVAPPASGQAPRAPSQEDQALLIASYPEGDPESLPHLIAESLGSLSPELSAVMVRVRRREDQAWTEQWKAFFTPRQIGRRVHVLPPWERDSYVTSPDHLRIEIDPGLAFGTGHHATTTLCAAVLEERLEQEPPVSLLDVGTGSGILAILAHRLGVRHVVGNDIDAAAIRSAQENLARNDIPAGAIELSTTPLAEIRGTFPWVVANILAPILIVLAPEMVAHVAASGQLLLSGLQAEQRQEVLDAYRVAAGGRALTVVHEAQQDEWVALLLRLG